MNIVGIIPARGGSKRTPRKNIKFLAGKPLIAHTIEAALRSVLINKLVVSTEDWEIAKAAGEYGAEVIIRPAELARDETKTAPVLIHVVEELEKQGYYPDIVVLLQPTCPLRGEKVIDGAISQLINSDKDSIFTGVNLGKTMPKWKRTYDGRLVSLYNYHFRPRTQEPELMEDMYAENGALYAIKIDAFKKHRDFLGSDVEIFETPSIVDIDTPEDFKRAEKTMIETERTSEIIDMFDNIANKYDFLNNIISFGRHKSIKCQAIKNVPLQKDMKILDICTGTGDIAFLVSELFDNRINITATDFSENMLKIAEKRAGNRKNITFVFANAINLPFEDDSFDAVFISFGLRNLTDLKKGINEIKRVLKDRGFVVNLDTGKPEGILGIIFKLYFFNIVPLIGKVFSGNFKAYRYLPKSTQSFPSQKELVKVFENSGFKQVKNYDFAFGAIAQQVAVNIKNN